MDNLTVKLIRENFSSSVIKLNENMKRHSYCGSGGVADIFVLPRTIEEIAELVDLLYNNHIAYYVLGKASNVLISDGNIDKVIIKTDLLNKTEIIDNIVTSECGEFLTKLSRKVAKEGLSGLEFAVGIPGSVGGGIYMNCGAYGCDIGSKVLSVDALIDGKIVKLSNKECGFSYRNSYFCSKDIIILSASFELKKENTYKIRQDMLTYTARRKAVQPNGRSLGCTFKNGDNFSAWELVERSGLKGKSIGTATVSEKHSNFIINGGNSKDVKTLIDCIKETVYNKTGYMLQEEIRYLGDF